jgi:hypothetical protein
MQRGWSRISSLLHSRHGTTLLRPVRSSQTAVTHLILIRSALSLSLSLRLVLTSCTGREIRICRPGCVISIPGLLLSPD